MVQHLRDSDVWDIYRTSDHVGRVLDLQEDRRVVVMRNRKHDTKVILRFDDETGAVEMFAEPNHSDDAVGSEPYHVMLGPEVPFSVLSALIENA
jgi:hypothetical protein